MWMPMEGFGGLFGTFWFLGGPFGAGGPILKKKMALLENLVKGPNVVLLGYALM